MQDQTAGSSRTGGVPDLRRPARPTRLSLPLWLLLTAGLWTAGLVIASTRDMRVGHALQAAAGVFILMFVYCMWTAVPEPSRRTSPLAAALCLLIPFYNIYWIFQAFWGYAMDFNRFASGLGSPDRPGIRKMWPSLGALFCFFFIGQIARVISPVLGLLVSLGWLVTLILFVTAVCRSVNSLADFVSRNVTPGTPVSGEPQPGRIPVSPKSPRNWPPMLIGALIVLLVAAGGVLMYSQKASRGAARNEAGLNSPAWKDVSPPGGRFTVQMPGEPTASCCTLSGAYGTVEVHQWQLQLNDTSAYGVSYVDMPLSTRDPGRISTVRVSASFPVWVAGS